MDPTAGDAGLLAGRYRLGGLLGRGGMAEVYDGFDERLARPVAVKLLRPSADPAMRERFAREARSAARLSHPAVVAVYDSGEEGGRSYLVMERLPGETLADRMRSGPVDPRWLATVAADVLGALGAAHDLGLVHRDIKPANILITADGRAKVADFGIAKTFLTDPVAGEPSGGDLTATGLILGTVAYLSPEQIDGAAASPQADLYALGVVLYEALAGRKPYLGDNPIAQARAAHDGQAADLSVVAPSVDPRLAAVVRRAMARRAEDRYPSAAAMRAALVATGLVAGEDPGGPAGPEPTVVTARPVPAETVALPRRDPGGSGRPPPGPPPPPAPPAGDDGRRRAGLIGAVIAVAVLVIVVAVIAVLLAHRHGSRSAATTTTSSAPSVATSVTTAPATTTSSSTTSTSTSTTVAASTTTLDPEAAGLVAYARQLEAEGGAGPDELASGLDQVAATTPGADRAAAATTVLQEAADLDQEGQITAAQYEQARLLLSDAGATAPTTTTSSTATTSTTTPETTTATTGAGGPGATTTTATTATATTGTGG
jgi:serine/threonine protein kinase